MTHPALQQMVEAAETQANCAFVVATQPANILSLAEYVRGLEEYAQAASEALLKVRPLGGSELFTRVGEQYLADPAYCGNEITSIRERLHSAKLAALCGKPKAKPDVQHLREPDVIGPHGAVYTRDDEDWFFSAGDEP